MRGGRSTAAADVPETDPARQDLTSILRCPRCGADATLDRCVGEGCAFNKGFPRIAGQPVLIDFEASLYDLASVAEGGWSTAGVARKRGALSVRLRQAINGGNPAGARCAAAMLSHLKTLPRRPRLLVVGGGAIGLGAQALYDDPDIDLVGTDVYASPHTQLLADGHSLPFKDQSFDGVWIQAVLEHVLEPKTVVGELLRVLTPDGLVYAETPFIQQVHEGAYDFTRFTLSGHRWLFRDFTELSSGTAAGAGVAFAWSVRSLLRAIGLPGPIAALGGGLTLPFRFLDRIGPRRAQSDGASCVYFLGRKDGVRLAPSDLIKYYERS